MKPAKKNGRAPGILWNAPTYVTELVGYLNRRNKTVFVCVFSAKIFVGQAPRACPDRAPAAGFAPTRNLLRDRLSIPHSAGHSPDRGQRIFCRRRGVAALGQPLAAAADGGRGTCRRTGGAQSS